jgi:hypothetical protein
MTESIAKRLELLESLSPQRRQEPETPALLALSENAIDMAIAVVDIVRWCSPVDPWAEGPPPSYPDSHCARELGFAWPDAGHKATGGQVQQLSLAVTDLLASKPPLTGEEFIARVQMIMKGESA